MMQNASRIAHSGSRQNHTWSFDIIDLLRIVRSHARLENVAVKRQQASLVPGFQFIIKKVGILTVNLGCLKCHRTVKKNRKWSDVLAEKHNRQVIKHLL